MRRLTLVAVLVLVLSVVYRDPLGFIYQDPETLGTGTLTLNQPWPTPGEEVPSFEARRLNGETFEMPQNGTYVVSFWSGLNQGSQSARPAFEELAREYGGSEVSFAAVYVGSIPRDDLRGAPYAVIKDSSGELTSRYNVKRVPRIFLVEDGVVRLTLEGFYENDEREMRRALEAALEAGD